MNCKQEDFAICTRSASGNEGAIVSVIAFLGIVPGYIGSDRWLVKSSGRLLHDGRGNVVSHLQDQQLRPVSGLPDAETANYKQFGTDLA